MLSSKNESHCSISCEHPMMPMKYLNINCIFQSISWMYRNSDPTSSLSRSNRPYGIHVTRQLSSARWINSSCRQWDTICNSFVNTVMSYTVICAPKHYNGKGIPSLSFQRCYSNPDGEIFQPLPLILEFESSMRLTLYYTCPR